MQLALTGEILTPMTAEEARQCVDEIKAGIFNVGRRLLDLYERDGWRALGYLSWRECAQVEFGYRQSRVYQLLEAAEIERNISTIVEIGQPIRESQLRPLTTLEPEQQPIAWQRAVETAPGGKITAAHVQAVVDDMRRPATPEPEPKARLMRQAKPESLHISDDSYEWFTPAEYIEAARRVMGSIDTDPASCATANQIVRAGTFYTVDDDGLLYDWPGNVWLNPPYNMPWIERFIDKAIIEYGSGTARAVMVLTNNSTDTAWFHKLLSIAPVCLTRGRIRFWGADGDTLATRQGQAIFYLGANPELFRAEFSAFGAVVSL